MKPFNQQDSMKLYESVTDVYPRARRQMVSVYFNERLATTTSRAFRRLSLKGLEEIIRKHNVRSVLDFGCGWGLNTILLKELFPELEIWSFDYSPQRVVSAQYNFQRMNLVPYRLFIADGSRLPLSDSSIDLIFTNHVLEQMNEVLSPALKEIHRVARRFALFIEPTYEYAKMVHRLRIIRKGYPRNIAGLASQLPWSLKVRKPANPTWAATPAEWVLFEKNGGINHT